MASRERGEALIPGGAGDEGKGARRKV